MEVLKTAPRPSTRLNKGNVLLANAQMVNTNAVKVRFDAFADVHRRYIEAHTKVDKAEALERGEFNRIVQIDGLQDRAIAGLSAALLLDGEPRRNPFKRFATRGPGQISKLSPAEKAKAVHDIVATLRRSMGLADATLAVADKAEQAATQVEEALPGWELRRTYLAMARQARDSLGTLWDTAYTALRHLAKSVVEEPDLYTTLFAQPRRNARKGKSAEPETPATDATPTDTAAIAEAPPHPPQAA